MNGFMIILTGALALLTLGLMVFLVGEGSNSDSFASPGSQPSVTRSQQADPLPEFSAGGSDTCQADGDVFRDGDKGQLFSIAESDVAQDQGAKDSVVTDNLNDPKLPDGLSLSITGTGAICK